MMNGLSRRPAMGDRGSGQDHVRSRSRAQAAAEGITRQDPLRGLLPGEAGGGESAGEVSRPNGLPNFFTDIP